MVLALHALWTPITLLLFGLWARPRCNPLADGASVLLTASSTRGGRTALWLGVAVLAANFLECLAEPALARALGYDLTPWVHSIEGDAVERVQATLPRLLVTPLVWFYVSGYIAALILPPAVWTLEERWGAVRATVAAYLFNYLLALPFYLFAPVTEVGWSPLSNAIPMLDEALPGLSGAVRVGSGLDNCLPSLHTSMTTTAAVLAWVHGGPRLRWIAGVCALATAYAVMALGVHWALDVVTGVPFGALCAGLGLAWARRVERRRAAGGS